MNKKLVVSVISVMLLSSVLVGCGENSTLNDPLGPGQEQAPQELPPAADDPAPEFNSELEDLPESLPEGFPSEPLPEDQPFEDEEDSLEDIPDDELSDEPAILPDDETMN